MDIIDFHGHFFPDEIAEHAITTVTEICNNEIQANLDGTLSDLITGMDRCGISKTVTLPVATKPDQVGSINANLPLENNRIIPFGALNPYSPNWEKEIDFLAEQGIKGIKLHPEYQGFYMNDPTYFPFYEKIASAGLIALFHAGYDPGPFTRDHALPKMFLDVKANIPSLTIVAGHFGGLLMWEDVKEHLMGKDIWFDTAAICDFIDPALFEEILNGHDKNMVLFGSDSPWEGQEKSIRFIEECSLPESIKEKILSLNARELLNLE